MQNEIKIIGIIGGSGALGSGLGYRLARAGYKIIVGSREPSKSFNSINEINNKIDDNLITVDSNKNAAEFSDLVILTVPFSFHEEMLKEISPFVKNKIVVDTTVPLVPPKVARVQLPEYGSVAKRTQDSLGNEVRVVSAFQNVAATNLHKDDFSHGEVLVFGNNKDSREIVIDLIEKIDLKGWHAGSIDNSVVAESLTSVLIFMNKYYKMDGAGIKINDSSLAS